MFYTYIRLRQGDSWPPLTQPCAKGVALAASTAFMPCRHPRWVLVTSILGSGLVFADGTALNIALPTIQRELSADVAAVQWIASAYSLPGARSRGWAGRCSPPRAWP